MARCANSARSCLELKRSDRATIVESASQNESSRPRAVNLIILYPKLKSVSRRLPPEEHRPQTLSQARLRLPPAQSPQRTFQTASGTWNATRVHRMFKLVLIHNLKLPISYVARELQVNLLWIELSIKRQQRLPCCHLQKIKLVAWARQLASAARASGLNGEGTTVVAAHSGLRATTCPSPPLPVGSEVKLAAHSGQRPARLVTVRRKRPGVVPRSCDSGLQNPGGARSAQSLGLPERGLGRGLHAATGPRWQDRSLGGPGAV
jgi:hypothetical protein